MLGEVTVVQQGKIKGVSVVGVVRALRADRVNALIVLPKRLHPYLDLRITITSWYPEEDFLELMKAFMRLTRNITWEQVGVLNAKEALTSVYRNIIVEGDVPETARRMRVNWRNYHDTGELSVENDPGLVRLTVQHYCLISADMCSLNGGYFRTLLSLSGARIQAVRKLRCTARGDPLCAWEFAWEDGAEGSRVG